MNRLNQSYDDDEDDCFAGGGFRIKINKEARVVNHLNDKVEGNLLFYNFNAYKEDNHSPQGGVPLKLDRAPSRSSKQGIRSSKSRKDTR